MYKNHKIKSIIEFAKPISTKKESITPIHAKTTNIVSEKPNQNIVGKEVKASIFEGNLEPNASR